MKFFIKFKSKLLLSIFFFSSIFIISCGDDSGTDSPIAAVKAYELPDSLNLNNISPLEASPKMDKRSSGDTASSPYAREVVSQESSGSSGNGYGSDNLYNLLLSLEYGKLELLDFVMLSYEYYDDFSECKDKPCFKTLTFTAEMAKKKFEALDALEKEYGNSGHADGTRIQPEAIPSCIQQTTAEEGYTHSIAVHELDASKTGCGTEKILELSYYQDDSDLMNIYLRSTISEPSIEYLYVIKVFNSKENLKKFTYSVSGEYKGIAPIDDKQFEIQTFAIDASLNKDLLEADVDFKSVSRFYSDADYTKFSSITRTKIKGSLSKDKGAEITVLDDQSNVDKNDDAPYDNVYKEKYSPDGYVTEAQKFEEESGRWTDSSHVNKELIKPDDQPEYQKNIFVFEDTEAKYSNIDGVFNVIDSINNLGTIVLIETSQTVNANSYCPIVLEAVSFSYGEIDKHIILPFIDWFDENCVFDSKESNIYQLALIDTKGNLNKADSGAVSYVPNSMGDNYFYSFNYDGTSSLNLYLETQ